MYVTMCLRLMYELFMCLRLMCVLDYVFKANV